MEVSYNLTTELNPYSNGGGRGVTGIEEENQPEQISHVTPSGKVCTIFYTAYSGFKDMRYSGYGYMIVDNILVAVEVMDASQELVRNTMIELLDGFE